MSEDSEIPFLNVLNKAVLEGCAELREEVYAPLINFNRNLAGKVVRERELTPVDQQVAEPASPENTGADQDGFADAGLERGYETPPPQDNELAGYQTVPSQRDFREAMIQTAHHIANHPPFFQTPPQAEEFRVPGVTGEQADSEDSAESTETESVG